MNRAQLVYATRRQRIFIWARQTQPEILIRGELQSFLQVMIIRGLWMNNQPLFPALKRGLLDSNFGNSWEAAGKRRRKEGQIQRVALHLSSQTLWYSELCWYPGHTSFEWFLLTRYQLWVCVCVWVQVCNALNEIFWLFTSKKELKMSNVFCACTWLKDGVFESELEGNKVTGCKNWKDLRAALTPSHSTLTSKCSLTRLLTLSLSLSHIHWDSHKHTLTSTH